MSYQRPPDREPDAPAGPPPGWYLDPGGLQVLRWWDGMQWSSHTQPLPEVRQEPQPPHPGTAAASSGYGAFGQQSAGRHQQGGLQDRAAHPPDLSSGLSPAGQSEAEMVGEMTNIADSGQPAVPGRVPLWRRPAALVIAGALGVAAVAGIVFAVTSGPGSFTAVGTDEVCVDAPDITDGTQVTVLDSAGHVLGTGSLAEDNSSEATKLVQQYDQLQTSLGQLGGGSGMSIYSFKLTGLPGGQSRYGITVGQNRGTIYFTEHQMRTGPGLDLGC